METPLWVVIFAVPKNVTLDALMKVRRESGADMMYPNRTRDALKLKAGDRVAAHFGGPRGSHQHAQHLIWAGLVAEEARSLRLEDVETYGDLYRLTSLGFPDFSYTPNGQEGIIRYRWTKPSTGVGPLPRCYWQPGQGDNFIRLGPGDQGFAEVDRWWEVVAMGGAATGPQVAAAQKKRYPLRGMPVTYLEPTEPVDDKDWEAVR